MFGLDFGEGFLKMVEERRGKKAADKFLGALVVGVYCIVALAVLAVLAALWALMKEAISLFGGLETPSIAAVSAFTIALLSIVMVIGRAIVLRLLRTAVPQVALNELARIRGDGINKLYASPPANVADVPRWEREYREWEKKIKEHLGAHFPSADLSRFSGPRRVGARNDPPATLALDRGGSARRAEPKGRVDALEVVKPQKAK